jgi:hypothetical protein
MTERLAASAAYQLSALRQISNPAAYLESRYLPGTQNEIDPSLAP